MKPKMKLERYYDDDDMYYIRGLSTREEKPVISQRLKVIVGAAITLTILIAGVALWWRAQ